MGVTLQNIADELGVSPATVSLALRNKKVGNKSLSPDTVAAVKATAARLGYRPNMLARNLAGQSSHTIGVLLSSLIFGSEQFLDGISNELRENFTPLVSVYNRDSRLEREEIGVLIGNRVAGIIAACSADPANADIYKELTEAYNIPLVFYSRRMPGITAPVVRADHFAATREGTRALISLGHSRILYAGVSFSKWIESHTMSIDGYTAAMREAGLESEMRIESRRGVQDWVQPVARRKICGEILDKWAAEGDRATAVLVDSDWLAYDILDVCTERGVKVPQDISLMGIGDYPFSAASYLQLSSVGTLGERSTQAAIGTRAARLLSEMMAGKPWDGKDIILPVEVRLRASTRRL
jgi:LacI family transcriptional regulator